MDAGTEMVLPGEGIQISTGNTLRLGPGVQSIPSKSDNVYLQSNKSGIMGQSIKREKSGQVENIWIESKGKRYIPSLGDNVVGVITNRHADGYRVDIGSAHAANLDALAFEVVYARVSLAHAATEPEVECVDPTTQKAGSFGELTGGMLVRNLDLLDCRRLLIADNPVLSSLGQQFPFEIAIGHNGRCWIKSADVENTITIYKAIGGQ